MGAGPYFYTQVTKTGDAWANSMRSARSARLFIDCLSWPPQSLAPLMKGGLTWPDKASGQRGGISYFFSLPILASSKSTILP
jgi:hypothetical protein